MAHRALGIVVTQRAPKAIGPYSQAVVVDGMVYTAGQIPLDPKSGAIVGASTAQQAEQVFKNLAAILEAADGLIVGTAFKRHNITTNPVESQRVRPFMEAVRKLRLE